MAWLNPWHEAASQRKRAQALELRLETASSALDDASRAISFLRSQLATAVTEPSPGQLRRQLALGGDPRPADD
jgi:hypothetical protein